MEIPVNDAAPQTPRPVPVLQENHCRGKAPVAALTVADNFPVPVGLQLVRAGPQLLEGNVQRPLDVLEGSFTFGPDIEEQRGVAAGNPIGHLRRKVLGNRSGSEKPEGLQQKDGADEPEKKDLETHLHSLSTTTGSPRELHSRIPPSRLTAVCPRFSRRAAAFRLLLPDRQYTRIVRPLQCESSSIRTPRDSTGIRSACSSRPVELRNSSSVLTSRTTTVVSRRSTA